MAAGTGGLVGLAVVDDVPVASADDALLLNLAHAHGRFRVCSFHSPVLLLFDDDLLAIVQIHAAPCGLAALLPALKIIPLPSIKL